MNIISEILIIINSINISTKKKSTGIEIEIIRNQMNKGFENYIQSFKN